jgi:acetamidase/formamidase
MAEFSLRPELATVHGFFSASIPPVLTIDPGDTVVFETLEAGWGIEPMVDDSGERRKLTGTPLPKGTGHALTGPVAVRGAQSGMTLAIRIDEIVPGDWGWTWAGYDSRPLGKRIGLNENDNILLRWTIDKAAGVSRNQLGHAIPIRPFMGVMGLAPDTADLLSTAPPRTVGGNIDCRELIAGSTLYLPVAVEGGLFSTGDGHAAQADGELSSTAIECPIARVTLTFDLLPDLSISTPRANTPAGWITFGFDEDLDEAMVIAVNAMIDLLGELCGLSRLEALALSSLEVHTRVTQVVNGVRGVHAVLPHDAIERLRVVR